MKTLEEARTELIKGVKDGIICPCCGRFAKVNKVSVSGTMARALSWIAKESAVSSDGWAMVQDNGPDWVKRSNSHAKLMHWGLLERKEAEDGSTLHSGVYRPTKSGLDFLKGKIQIKKTALIYNNKMLTAIGQLVSVTDCLGAKFHFGETL